MHEAVEPGDPPSGRQRSAAVRVSADGTRRVYTRRGRTFLAALAVFGFTVAAGGLGSEISVGDASTGRALFLGIYAVGLLAAYRVMRMAVVVTPGRLTLRGFWRTRSLCATDVEGFEPPLPYGMSTATRPGLRVLLSNGRTSSAGVFERSKLDDSSVGLGETAELNLWLHHQRCPDAATPALPTRYGLTGAAAFAWYAWCGLLGLLVVLSVALVVDTLVTLDDLAGSTAAR